MAIIKGRRAFQVPGTCRDSAAVESIRGEAFCRGEIEECIAAYAKTAGGVMTATDLAGHKSEWVELISGEYHGFNLNGISPTGQAAGFWF